MYSASDFLKVMNQTALAAVETSKPSGIFYGVVTSVAPLEIQVDQKLTLRASQLQLTSLVSDFTVTMTVQHETEDAAGPEKHRHAYAGDKQFAVHLGLVPGENVILLRTQGGQKFVVLDRVRA